MDTIIRSRHILKGNPENGEFASSMRIRDGVIIAFDEEAEQTEGGGEAAVIDCGDLCVAPGLIDYHVHFMWSGKPKALFQAIGKPESLLALQGAANCLQALQAGITTARDCGGLSRVILPLKQVVEDGIIPGPRIIACGEAITVTGGHCHFLEMEAEGITAVQRAVRTLQNRGADFIKVMATGGGATPGSNVRRSQYSAAEFDAMAADAHRLGKKITAHAHGTEGIRLLVDACFDGIEHCSWVPKEGGGFDYDEAYAEKIRKQGITVCRSIAGFERWPLEECGPEHQAWDSYEPLRLMVNDGINLVAGTDAGIDYTDFAGLHWSLETMVGLGGMDHARAFCSATTAAAAALEMDDRIGSLDIGKKADCIAVCGNPAEDIRALRKVFFVMKEGKTVVDLRIKEKGEY